MLNKISEFIAGNYNEKQIAKLQPIVEQINKIYEQYDALSDDEIKAKTPEFKKRIADGESLDDLLPEAFATVKQACKRMVGKKFPVKGEQQERNMIPYDVQLIGAIVLHRGTIAEMKTGEGKTLVAAMPVYLNALAGKGVHVVTVNDYLASRDAEWMGHLYQWLGMSVGTVVKGVDLSDRHEQYACDITYVENSELGFDYLRDNLVKTKAERNLLWRPLHFAVIDEIDSILIDEARTPLIISRPADEPTDKYLYYAKIARTLTPAKGRKKVSKGFLQEWLNDEEKEEADTEDQKGDYFIDVKTKTANLSSAGIARLEKMLKVENLYRDLGYQEIHHIENALKATGCYIKDKDYIVREGQVMIVDQNTGRVMPGRRFSQGLHQAIEAKENVKIQRESKTMATITYQNFFKQYKKLAGMTGTATTEGEEFEKIYELEVLAIPTNKPVIRVDKGDKVYFSQKAKRKHAVDYISFAHEMGQPILIGTSSIDTSEYVASLLKKHNITHSILNAKHHESEAKIVSNGGKAHSVVVATNMAGRGTDIKLEKGLNQSVASNYAKRIHTSIHGQDPKVVSVTVYSDVEYDLTIDAIQKEFGFSEDAITASYKDWHQDHEQHVAIKTKINTNKKRKNTDAFAEIIIKDPDTKDGDLIEKDLHYGLMILATEKHDSRRIDNQLRGRAGRQGDPGVSMFIVALDDEIMKKVGGEKIRSMATMLLSADELNDMELTQKQFTRSIERAQKQMEARHFSIRKHLFDYDTVVDKQRQKIYSQRDMMLDALDQAEKENTSSRSGTEGNEGNPESVKANNVISTEVEKSKESPVLESIRELVPSVVDTTIKSHLMLKTSFEELEQITQKEFAIQLSAEELENLNESNSLEQTIIAHILQKLVLAEKTVALPVVNRILATTYLNVIDRYRVDHIDTMQQLRDKVGLMSYAQQDPLVIYKKEAYEKFQSLNTNISHDTVVTVANIDWEDLGNRITRAEEQRKQQHQLLMEKLKAGASGAPAQTIDLSKAVKKTPQKVVYQDEDGFEIIEMEGGDSSHSSNPSHPELDSGSNTDNSGVIDTNKDRKLRPNDKVIVRYKDGSVKYDMKYKKIKKDVEAGKAEIIG